MISVLFGFPVPHLHLLPTFPNIRAELPLSWVTHCLSDWKHKTKFLPIHEQNQINNVENMLMTDFCIAEDTAPLPIHPQTGLWVVSFCVALLPHLRFLCYLAIL